jgi:hypothetical protein
MSMYSYPGIDVMSRLYEFLLGFTSVNSALIRLDELTPHQAFHNVFVKALSLDGWPPYDKAIEFLPPNDRTSKARWKKGDSEAPSR